MRKNYGDWLKEQLGCKVQKISLNAGFTCPNRDGRVGRGGCTYCNNQTFNPSYCATQKTVTQQLEEGKAFFGKKYPDMKYLAYFQAYTNTYGDVEHCISLYEEALRVTGVVGLVIATRPDCMPDELLDYLAELNKRTFLIVEYGVESASDKTLEWINRGHSWQQSVDAINKTAERGIRVGAHIILGFPTETHDELMQQAEQIGQLPLTSIKLHQLQIIRGTHLARTYEDKPWPMPTIDEYIELVRDYVSHIPQGVILERFVSSSPKELLIAPNWGLKNHEFANLLRKYGFEGA